MDWKVYSAFVASSGSGARQWTTGENEADGRAPTQMG